MIRRNQGDWLQVGFTHKAVHRFAYGWHNKTFARTKGRENIPATGGFLYVGNHTSWWDPIFMSATTPRPVRYLAKSTLGNSKFGQWFIFDSGGCIPVDRNRANPDAYKAAIDALRAGGVVGVFPEGTRHAGEMGRAKTGVARMALEAGVPVVPAGFTTDRFWPPTKKVPAVREPVYVNIGAPRTFTGDPNDASLVRKVTDDIMVDVKRLLDEAKGARDRKDKWARVP